MAWLPSTGHTPLHQYIRARISAVSGGCRHSGSHSFLDLRVGRSEGIANGKSKVVARLSALLRLPDGPGKGSEVTGRGFGSHSRNSPLSW